MSDHMNKYADFIAKQQKELRASTVNTINEAKSPQVKNSKAYDQHKKLAEKGEKDLPLKGVSGFHHKDSDMADQGYIIKHASGNVSHTVTDEHDTTEDHFEKASRRDNPHLSDKEHKEVAKAIAKNQ